MRSLLLTSVAVLRTTPTGVENSDQLGTPQQISRNKANSGPLKLPKLLSVLPTSSVQTNSSPYGCCNNQKQEEAFHAVSLAFGNSRCAGRGGRVSPQSSLLQGLEILAVCPRPRPETKRKRCSTKCFSPQPFALPSLALWLSSMQRLSCCNTTTNQPDTRTCADISVCLVKLVAAQCIC